MREEALDLTWSQLNSFNSCSATAMSREEEWRCGGEEKEKEEEEDDNKGRGGGRKSVLVNGSLVRDTSETATA